MTHQDKIAILITCFNKAEHIEATVRSAIENGCRVIVVDDCSTDTSWDIIQSFDGIVSFRSAQNGGASDATLKAVEIAEDMGFAWIALLDGDDVIAPNAVDYFAAVLEETGADAVYSTPDRTAGVDRRVAVSPVAQANYRVLEDPFSDWLNKPRASTALCGKLDVIKKDLCTAARIQDHQIAFSIHRNSASVVYSDARTHFYSIAKPGENLVLDGREGGRSAVIAYSLHWEKVRNHPKGYKYQKRAFSALTKLRKYDVFGSVFTTALYAITPFKSLMPAFARHKLLTYAAAKLT